MPGKLKIVVSDLHLSAGQQANPLEDFDHDEEFAAFLEEVTAESDARGAEVELIVNGDAFEMLQVPHVDRFDPDVVYEPEQYHSSSEEDSVRKMAIIIAGHRLFFEALRGFMLMEPPRRTVTIVKGNHDLNLHWDGVQDRIRQATGATGNRASLLTFEERRISREGIYVEHGNQYAAFVDQVEDMEEPHDHDKPGQLAIPPGSWFVMDVFSQIERDKYWIDGIKPITALVWYALAFDFRFAAKAIAALIRAMPGIVWHGFLSFGELEAQALPEQLEDPSQVEELAKRYESDEAFRARFNADLANMLARSAPSFGIAAQPSGLSDPVGLGDRVREQVNSSLFEMAARRAAEEGVKLVTFGHTHDAGVEPLPDGGVYINSGTWTWRADFGGVGKQTWRDLFEHPERFTGDQLLSYVRIDYDEAGRPTGELREYQPKRELEAPPIPETLGSFWRRLVVWLRGVWGRLTGAS